MIKYFQKLRAKKGFTLVELIVVIAIIGVLAAILIPTMLGYVTQSKVTSANSTAASIKNEIDALLTQFDTVNQGMKKGSKLAVLTVTIGGTNTAATDWKAEVTNNTTSFNGKASDGTTNGWDSEGTGATDGKGSKNKCTVIASDLADLFPEIKTGMIKAYLMGGKCYGVLYVNGATELPSVTWTDESHEWPTGAKWANNTAGIYSSGDIVGTAPVIPLDSSATANNWSGQTT